MTGRSSLTATGILTAAALRRDRVVAPAWVYALSGTVAGTAYSFRQLYPTSADRAGFARGVEHNAAILAMVGRLYSTRDVGGLVSWRLLGFGSTLVAVMSVLLVVRHTRADEESQRAELLRSGAVGRYAPLGSALILVLATNVVVALASATVLVALGLPLNGSLAFGLAWLSAGIVFLAVGALAAQLTETSRAANGLAMAVVGGAFALRAIGDAAGPGTWGWLSWLSPIGWAQRSRPFAGDRWSVLLLSAGLAALVLVVAIRLDGRRDVGAGVVRPRPGPSQGGRSLAGPLGLAWRLQRGPLLGWACGLMIMGLLAGAITSSVGQLIGGSAQATSLIAKLGGSSRLIDGFLAVMTGFAGLLTAAFAVAAVLRLREEEAAGRAEHLLAGPVSRSRWAASHLLPALVGGAALLSLMGMGMGVSYGLQIGDVSGQVPRLTGALLGQLPGVWVLAAAAFVIVTAAPRFASAAWGLLAGCLLLDELGPSLDVPAWLLALSPFSHLPKLPAVPWNVVPFFGVLAAAALLLLCGGWALRRRDLR